MSRSLELNAKQGEAFQTTATEVLYGGAAGSEKSHLIRVAAIYWSTATIASLKLQNNGRKLCRIDWHTRARQLRSTSCALTMPLIIDVVAAP
jgi:hypothetical protein